MVVVVVVVVVEAAAAAAALPPLPPRATVHSARSPPLPISAPSIRGWMDPRILPRSRRGGARRPTPALYTSEPCHSRALWDDIIPGEGDDGRRRRGVTILGGLEGLAKVKKSAQN